MQHPISLTHSITRKISSALLLSKEDSEIFKEKIKPFKLHCHHYYYYYCLMAKSPDAINQWSQWCYTNFNSMGILDWVCCAVLELEQRSMFSVFLQTEMWAKAAFVNGDGQTPSTLLCCRTGDISSLLPAPLISFPRDGHVCSWRALSTSKIFHCNYLLTNSTTAIRNCSTVVRSFFFGWSL